MDGYDDLELFDLYVEEVGEGAFAQISTFGSFGCAGSIGGTAATVGTFGSAS